MNCRHCGNPIRRHGGRANESWNHTIGGSLLHRCQGNVPRYGYDAAPPSDQPCECFACGRYGPTDYDITRLAAPGPSPLTCPECHAATVQQMAGGWRLCSTCNFSWLAASGPKEAT